MGDIFTKVSSFYSKDGLNHITSFWEKKSCTFIVNRIDGGETIMISKKEIDMSPHVEKSDVEQKIWFDHDEVLGLYIDVEWTITPTNESKNNSAMGSGTQMKLTDNFTEDQIQEFMENAKKLEEEKSELEQQVE